MPSRDGKRGSVNAEWSFFPFSSAGVSPPCANAHCVVVEDTLNLNDTSSIYLQLSDLQLPSLRPSFGLPPCYAGLATCNHGTRRKPRRGIANELIAESIQSRANRDGREEKGGLFCAPSPNVKATRRLPALWSLPVALAEDSISNGVEIGALTPVGIGSFALTLLVTDLARSGKLPDRQSVCRIMLKN